MTASILRNGRMALPCLVVGAVCFGLGAVSFVLSRNFFDSVIFARHGAHSLSDPGVAAYVADLITSQIVHRKPDMIAVRPMLLSATESVVSSRPFRSLVEQAATRAHQAAFSEGAEQVLLSLPDLNVLVHDALRNASPALAAKVPKSLDSAIASLAEGRTVSMVLGLARTGKGLRRVWIPLFVVAVLLCILALWLAHDRQRAMMYAGVALIVTGLVLAGLAAMSPLAGLWIHQAKELGLVRGLWRAYLGDLTRWAFFFCGIGVLVASGASSLLDRVDPFEQLARSFRRLADPPLTRLHRFLRGMAFFVCGCLIFTWPGFMLTCAAIVIGICVAYAGSRELFRVFLDSIDASQKTAPQIRSAPERRLLRTALTGLLVVILAGAWFVWRNPVANPVRAAGIILACNGFPELCDRRVDEVVFAGAHNAMSNQEAAGWMFPHHEAGMPQMLRDGIRALLVDVHYGFAGGSRIKTDMSMEPNADSIRKAVGAEGYAAAMRIRDRLVGVDESQRGLYFCHGFCELGAYPVASALREVRDFLVGHPDEVILMVVEDTVTPQDLAAEFQKARLTDLIYAGSVSPPWPTLRQLIESGKRLLVFTESGRSGVPWLRPAFETLRETPYSFHKVEDFSCRANRGGDAGSLFQINHWIDTTPTPKPSNAAMVNAYPFLLSRAEDCAAERRRLPNLIAVDFYQTGDLLAVVNKLNRVGPAETLQEPQ